MYRLKHFALLLIFLFSSDPSNGAGFNDLLDEIIKNHIACSLTHKEIVYTFGRLNHRFNQMSKQDWTWKNTNITQKQRKEHYTEFDLLIANLKNNPHLSIERLYISVTKVYPEEFQVLRKWLSKNNTLESLSLVRCALTGTGYSNGEEYLFYVDLKEWLESNETLKELDLSGNPLGYSTSSIIKALRKNKGLKRLILDNTYPQTDRFSETFDKDLAQNKTLRYAIT